MRLRSAIALACPLVVAAALVGPAAAVPATAKAAEPPVYEMPFPCKDVWTGSTRSGHSPSFWSVDFNKDGDLGSPMVASAPGVVTTTANLGDRSYGRYVVVDHGDGFSTLYAHLQAQFVTVGQTVDEGWTMGLVGESGNVTGPHLHYEQRLDGTGQRPFFHGKEFKMPSTQASQNCLDVPIAGRWTKGADATGGVFRRTPKGGKFRLRIPGESPRVIAFGNSHDIPITGDWNGDGVTDVGVRRPATKDFLLRKPNGSTQRVAYGSTSAVPVAGDWNGDGTHEVGLWNPGSETFTLRRANGKTRKVKLGSAGSLPVTGDWDGNGVTDVGVYDQKQTSFTLVSSRDKDADPKTVDFGRARDLPVSGDWNSDGKTDLGLWRPSTAKFLMRVSSGKRAKVSVTTVRFGRKR